MGDSTSINMEDHRDDGCSDHDQVIRRGPWTLEEDTLLLNYIARHGEGRWNFLATAAGLKRNGKSCRLRWLNYLKPDIKRGNLTRQEQLLILELHSKWGNRWSKIAQHLPGRTDNEVKNYWRTRVQKQAKLLNLESNSQSFLDAVRSSFWTPAPAGGGGGEGEGGEGEGGFLQMMIMPPPPQTTSTSTSDHSTSLPSSDNLFQTSHQTLIPSNSVTQKQGPNTNSLISTHDGGGGDDDDDQMKMTTHNIINDDLTLLSDQYSYGNPCPPGTPTDPTTLLFLSDQPTDHHHELFNDHQPCNLIPNCDQYGDNCSHILPSNFLMSTYYDLDHQIMADTTPPNPPPPPPAVVSPMSAAMGDDPQYSCASWTNYQQMTPDSEWTTTHHQYTTNTTLWKMDDIWQFES